MAANPLDMEVARRRATEIWDGEILPSLSAYVAIPNLSQAFDADWAKNGHMVRAANHIAGWCRNRKIPGLTVKIVEIPGKPPVIIMNIPATDGGNGSGPVLMYGHLDKQPPFEGWHEGLGPWTPVVKDGKLYGRGAADDGYAAYASLAAIELLIEQGVPHKRIVVLIEAGEESGSPDLPQYMELLAEKIGNPSLVVCLDAGCGNYDQPWITTSLRGLVTGRLTVEVLKEGVHSGHGTGIIPSAERIQRMLLDRIEDVSTGNILLPSVNNVAPPQQRLDEIQMAAAALGAATHDHFPFVAGARPVSSTPVGHLIDSTRRGGLMVTGADGFPPTAKAGNVVLPSITYMLSLRIPPEADPVRVAAEMKQVLEANPPYGVAVSFEIEKQSAGWDAPATAPWLGKAIAKAAQACFGKPALAMGLGGSIPFMQMLGLRFPTTQFLVTGVLGPNSNAHGPNEFLHIAYAQELTALVASVIADHASRE